MCKKSTSLYLRLLSVVFCAMISSCARSTVYVPLPSPSIPTKQIRKDVVHTVAPGETVWRLAKMYDVDVKDILRANKIKSPQDLKMGQDLRIPYAAPLKPFIPLYATSKWKYIVIHHSATDEGNALGFNTAHHQRGFDRGLGYHFVIDNGTRGKKDGQIEISPRWIKQQDGAHCKASNMNKKAIGICLVGNFSEDTVSSKQMDSLVFLVRMVQEYYNIPSSRIIEHGQVSGAQTECPGTKFSWQRFKRLVK